MVQLKQQSFSAYLHERYGLAANGQLTDFLSRRDGQLLLGDVVNLNELARRYGAPLEVVYCPQISNQVQRMLAWAASARNHTEYSGAFLYAYATKANFAAEAVQTALDAGAHYETSAAADVEIAHYLWQQGILPADRLICCNGSKEPHYLAAITNLRVAGCDTVIPVLDDLDELTALLDTPQPLRFGVRERAAGNRDGLHPGNDRFGLSENEIDQAAARIAGSPHRLELYHAMIGSQIEDEAHFLNTLRASVEHYCRLRRQVPTLRYFNFGGGMPTSGYSLGFAFDYEGFLRKLMQTVRDTCADYAVPMPDLIGEFGRYTVATHSLYLLEVGQTKPGPAGDADWYLLNGSLMVSLPDSVLVPNQEFVILPLEGWERPVQPARLAGRRTCDSDDVYPRPGRAPLMLPQAGGHGQILAFCGVGAYQQMISGRGGAHHCLNPEPQRIVIRKVGGRLTSSYMPAQSRAMMMQLLGYGPRRMPEPLVIEDPQEANAASLPLHIDVAPRVNGRRRTGGQRRLER
jgi:arginine decarboxylase